jgi:hypothetical protein
MINKEGSLDVRGEIFESLLFFGRDDVSNGPFQPSFQDALFGWREGKWNRKKKVKE